MKFKEFIVITRVGEPREGGNLCTALGSLWMKTANARANITEEFASAESILGHKVLDLYKPVFTVGEVLRLDHNDRDQFGRKPYKWDVQWESFATAEEAFDRAFELTLVGS